jgi:hypothetical protein
VSGLSVEREGPADDEQQGRRGKLVEVRVSHVMNGVNDVILMNRRGLVQLNVMGRYATVWVCLKTGQRVSFQKASLLRNAGESPTHHTGRQDASLQAVPICCSPSFPCPPASTASPHALFAVCPEVTKYLNKDQMPFYSAARCDWLDAAHARCIPHTHPRVPLSSSL